ncbi:MAG: hypothetical protein GVY19_13440 [Bacteroidetes bacterium]|jgi:signal transduction histidine kinase|nr:hypothetical protein [Bacteroidota bacterium]
MFSKIKIKLLNKPEQVKKTILWVTFFFTAFVYIHDLLNFTSNQVYSFWVNVVSLSVIGGISLLYLFRTLSVQWAYGIGVYSILANIIFEFINYSNSGSLVYHYYRSSFFLITLIGLTAYVVHHNHALIMGFIHLIISVILIAVSPHHFVTSNLPIVAAIFAVFTFITYYFVGGLKDYMLQLQELNVQIQLQNENIKQQNEELKTQSENLRVANSTLVEQRNQIISQHDELEKANNAKDKFFSILAHDLKNPINLIVNFADMLRNNFSQFNDNKKLEYVDSLKETSENTYKLLENILYWARSQTGRLKVNKVKLDVMGVFYDTKTIYEESIKSKGIQVHFPGMKSCTISSDQDMIYTIIRNLFSNALKYTPDGGNIWLETELTGASVSIAVKDDGLGMKPGIKDNLFSTESTITTDGIKGEKGTGLGLIICQELVERLEGNIRVESEPGKGSQFIVTLPNY